jgi:pantetheine-phosphate adenylyltransferase
MRVLFPGSFNPFTIGHKNIVDRALKLFDSVVVAVGVNSEKK